MQNFGFLNLDFLNYAIVAIYISNDFIVFIVVLFM